MSMLDGVSQCWWLSRDCVVWWDAWAVAVGLIVGGATVVVAYRSWLTSNRAADIAADTAGVASLSAKIAADSARIANDAKEIAAQQHKEIVEQRQRTAKILGSLFDLEIALLPTRIGAVIETLDEASISSVGTIIGREELSWIVAELSSPALPTADSAQDRLHCLENGLGEGIAQIIGMGNVIRLSARRAAGRAPSSNEGAEVVIPNRADGRNDFMLLRVSLLSFLAESIAVAREFAKFTGSDRGDFAYEEELIKKKR